MDYNNLLERALSLLNLQPDKTDEQETIRQINAGVSFRGANLWVLIFAIFIASLGLNVNSTAVIIGAMLISPLMGPIIGMGLAAGINDVELMKRSFKNYAVATLVSVLTATVYFLLTPLSEAQSELLARTAPTLYDVLIAFCGGAAGIIAICTGGKGNIIPGVAIATALMPPLCTAGFGLGTGHFVYFLGAFYLFFINTVFIALATALGVRLMHFHRREFRSPEQVHHARNIVMSVVLVTVIPAALMTVHIVRKSVFDRNVNQFVKTELQQKGTQVISTDVNRDSLTLRVVAVGREISEAMQAEASRRLVHYGLGDYRLSVIQGAQTDSLMELNSRLTQAATTREGDRQKLLELSAENAELVRQLGSYTRLEELAVELRPELATLFPQVERFSLSLATESNRDTTAISCFVAAVATPTEGTTLVPADREKLYQWLQTRLKVDSLALIVP